MDKRADGILTAGVAGLLDHRDLGTLDFTNRHVAQESTVRCTRHHGIVHVSKVLHYHLTAVDCGRVFHEIGKIMEFFLCGRISKGGTLIIDAGDIRIIDELDDLGGLGGDRRPGLRGDLIEHFFRRNRLKAIKRMNEPIIGHLAFPDTGERGEDLPALTGGGRGLLCLLVGKIFLLAFAGFFTQ